ncbi:MAG TPA: serine hydrolase [Terriglobales bacterium]
MQRHLRLARKTSGCLCACTSLLFLCGLTPVLATAQTAAPAYPGAEWERTAPESEGFSSARLEALRTWLKTEHTTAMMVAAHGKVIFEYGDLRRASDVASIRKSVLAMLYGKYVFNGTVELNKTVKEIGLDDVQKFLPIEKVATLEQLLTARSGIYIPTGLGNLDPDAPRRGANPPGSYFYYNSWDFNAAGTAFEKLTGKNIYDALDSDLARPIGMQDFSRAQQKKVSAMPASVHEEYPMYLSTRDMERLGLLMLRDGDWKGQQVEPRDWCRYITRLITPLHDINPPARRALGQPDRWGYGVMWWVWDAPVWPGGQYGAPFQGAYMALGSGGQYITVLPALNLVIAHKVDIDADPQADVNTTEYSAIVQMVIASACSGRCPGK